ncbi:DUF3800 domain-containing protein [Cupriavidus agavae]|uniref:DUF3800 domain-containing protein n=1 Tax=Cupriavidus agavae TaxID=1001822 RepID=A0A4Q7SBI7_9BURK|nr:DUF3800 domain-containing protein [Cupriavidus agavae]RZT43187.1 hypothetical protein EV147_2237 [Cupriavidus agavae]
MAITIYLDECGCLGWQLDKPYQQGGSSRHFTLAAVVIADGDEANLSRPVRGLYKKRGRALSNELKAVQMSATERCRFASDIAKAASAGHTIQLRAITARKTNVSDAFRAHPNGLYHYMTRMLLLDVMADHRSVSFIPDARSMKDQLKHFMHDYLRLELAVRDAATSLQTTPWESNICLPLQFTDIIASIVWAHHEFNNSIPFRHIEHVISQRTLFFQHKNRHSASDTSMPG